MNLFQLVLKQMRQRALGTWLTLLSVTLGVGLAVAVLLVYRGSESLFGQKDYGYDLIIGKGSPLQLVLNTVYHIDQSPGNIPYSLYETLSRDKRQVKVAIPVVVGDSYKGRRIIGTLPQMFGFTLGGNPIEEAGNVFNYRPGRRFEFAEGTVFHPRKFEAVVGSEVPELTGLKLGDTFNATHGAPEEGQREHVHEDEQWRVVGVLKPTNTSNDRVIFIPLVTTYCNEEHSKGIEAQAQVRAAEAGLPPPAPVSRGAAGGDGSNGDLLVGDAPPPAPTTTPAAAKEGGGGHDDHDHHEHTGGEGHAHEHAAYTVNADGTVDPKIPKEQWLISAIMVKSRHATFAARLTYDINSGATATAVSPAMTMSEFFEEILKNSTLALLLISVLVILVAAVGILVSIYNSVAARKREIAILRALGATKARVLTLICLEAGLIGLAGGVLGWVLGHALAVAGSRYMEGMLGQGFSALSVGPEELAFLAGVVVIALLAGLVPALKAYRTPVATNLVAA
jgi:putative ABC transport system permease protein